MRYAERSKALRLNGFWDGLGRALENWTIVEEYASAFSAPCEPSEPFTEVGAATAKDAAGHSFELALLMPLGASHKLIAFRNGATLIGVLALPECSAAK